MGRRAERLLTAVRDRRWLTQARARADRDARVRAFHA